MTTVQKHFKASYKTNDFLSECWYQTPLSCIFAELFITTENHDSHCLQAEIDYPVNDVLLCPKHDIRFQTDWFTGIDTYLGPTGIQSKRTDLERNQLFMQLLKTHDVEDVLYFSTPNRLGGKTILALVLAGDRISIMEAYSKIKQLAFETLSKAPEIAKQHGKLLYEGLVTPYERQTLTKREHQIFMLLPQGMTNDEIGHQLFISPRTVDKHIENIHVKLGTKNKLDLISQYAAAS